MELEYLKYNRS